MKKKRGTCKSDRDERSNTQPCKVIRLRIVPAISLKCAIVQKQRILLTTLNKTCLYQFIFVCFYGRSRTRLMASFALTWKHIISRIFRQYFGSYRYLKDEINDLYLVTKYILNVIVCFTTKHHTSFLCIELCGNSS